MGVLLDRAPPRYDGELGTIAARLLRERHCEVPDASPEMSSVNSVSEAELGLVASLFRYRHG